MHSEQSQSPGFLLDLGPLKEPLGIIRVLEWIFSICAFATAGGYSGTSHFTVKCTAASVEQHVDPEFGYPFRLPAKPYHIPFCYGNITVETFLQGDFSSSAEFFVCVGVFGFLYCTATLVLYLGFQDVYRQTSRGPIIDLVLTACFAFLWLVSSSAWAKGLTDIKWATNPEHLVTIETCRDICHAGDFPSMARLNASVILGFLNLILWAGNCWFIFKRHKDLNPPVIMEEEESPFPFSVCAIA